MARFTPFSTALVKERAVLVGVDRGRAGEWPLATSMAELARLVDTDGAEVVGELTQRLDRPVPKTFIGSGKVEELKEYVAAHNIDVVVFDDELTPSQQSNLERALGEPVKVIDRTALILDIFGRHATTSEGRLQVQLAQLQYILPRLRGMWTHLMGEQTRGGIGSRFGQGESQLEVDRRLIRNRISKLREDLATLQVRRDVQSKARRESGLYRIALAGYTNAGKSTLLKALSGAEVYIKDELFATLDPTTRSLALEDGRMVTLTDTVGFIQKLPTKLVEAFKSTLSEVNDADLIVEVVDVSDAHWQKELDVVNEILEQIGAKDKQRLVCFNKIDELTPQALDTLRMGWPRAVCISAKTGEGLGDLLHAFAEYAARDAQVMTVLLPYDAGALANRMHETCQIIHEQYEQEGLLATIKAPSRIAPLLERYRTSEEAGA